MLRCWTLGEAIAISRSERCISWALDFPAEGDRIIAGILTANPELLVEHGHRLIIERGTGSVVGSVGLFWPPHQGTVEIGYGIVPSRRRRGYASEATRALATFALGAPGIHTVVADVDISNTPSIRALEKSGFERCGSPDGAFRYRISRECR
ncbi:GNAT family N-acetyltransferase [Streptomyces collinus]|uniref:GNAT family N-acetyltransferase n=1 Tax=Streptomyces collinus TaxID=42684 RepID=UPI0036E0CC72